MISVDWLSVSQLFDIEQYKDFGSGRVLKIGFDPLGNEFKEWESYSHSQVLGSFDTSLRVRMFQGRLDVSGNPSKFGRSENFFGYTSVDDAINLCFNPLLESLGLPVFKKGVFLSLSQVSDDLSIRSGAFFTRVDLCINYSAGRDLPKVFRYLETITHRGKRATVHSDNSFSWGSRKHRRFKIYNKVLEFVAHNKKYKECPYLTNLVGWASSVGLFRFETEYHADFLRQNGLRFWHSFDFPKVLTMFNSFLSDNLPDAGLGGINSIFDMAIDLGFPPLRSTQLQAFALSWAAGNDVFGSLKRSSAYTLRNDLLNFGIDIRKPLSNVEQINARVQLLSLKVAECPDFYRSIYA